MNNMPLTLIKLSLRNVRRQAGKYLIYFVTLVTIMSLLSSISYLIFSSRVQELANDDLGFQNGLLGIVIFGSSVMAVVMGYATSFLVKLRRKEFGLYLISGMNKRDILSIYITESTILSLIALGIGLCLGIFFSQILSILFSLLLKIPNEPLDIPLKGVVVALAIGLGVFIISSISAGLYLSKVTIIDLLKTAKKEKRIKHLWLHIILFLSYAALLVVCLFKTKHYLFESFEADADNPTLLLLFIVLSLGLVFLVHLELAKIVTEVLIRFRKYSEKGTRIVVLRNLSGVMSINSVLIAFVALLITFSIGMACIGIVEKKMCDSLIDTEAPFDIMGTIRYENEYSISPEEAESIIGSYISDYEKLEINLYSNGGTVIQNSFDDMYLLKDVFVSVSDYNLLLNKAGLDSIEISDGQFIPMSSYYNLSYDSFGETCFDIDGIEYKYGNSLNNMPAFINQMAYIIVPDKAITNMEVVGKSVVYDFDEEYDYKKLKEELSYMGEDFTGLSNVLYFEVSDELDESEQFESYSLTDFILHEDIRSYYTQSSALLLMGSGYLAIVFMLMSLSILALKMLSEIEEDRIIYSILTRLGVNHSYSRKTLRNQVGIFFLVPIVGPLALIYPFADVFGKVIEKWNVAYSTGFFSSLGVSAIIVIIYVIYFMITYNILAKEVIAEPNI